MRSRVLLVVIVYLLLTLKPIRVYGGSSASSDEEIDVQLVMDKGATTDGDSLNENDVLSKSAKYDLNVTLSDGGRKLSVAMHVKRTVMFKVSTLCSHMSDVTIIKVREDNRHTNVLTVDGIEVSSPCVSYTRSGDIPFNTTNSVAFSENTDDSGNASNIEAVYATRDVNVTVYTGRIGVSHIIFEAHYGYNSSVPLVPGYLVNKPNRTVLVDIFVLREASPLDLVFLVCVFLLAIFEMVAFGTQLDFTTVRKTLKKPLAPLLGLVCQYIAMPLIAYGMAETLETDPLVALGIFVTGICPGGGSSNIYSYLLDGDLSLSITMTTISTLLSLGMMPLWLYTLGHRFMKENVVSIPYVDILLSLSVIIVPLIIGIFIKQKLPKLAKLLDKSLAIVLTLLCIAVLTIGIYTSWYLFRLFNWKSILFGCSLPYVGFLLGGVLAFICRQPWTNIKTIALEAGMQNVGIGYILLVNTFPSPLDDLASIVPLAASVFSPIPPLLASIWYHVWVKCRRKYKLAATLDMEKDVEVTEMVELSLDDELDIQFIKEKR